MANMNGNPSHGKAPARPYMSPSGAPSPSPASLRTLASDDPRVMRYKLDHQIRDPTTGLPAYTKDIYGYNDFFDDPVLPEDRYKADPRVSPQVIRERRRRYIDRTKALHDELNMALEFAFGVTNDVYIHQMFTHVLAYLKQVNMVGWQESVWGIFEGPERELTEQENHECRLKATQLEALRRANSDESSKWANPNVAGGPTAGKLAHEVCHMHRLNAARGMCACPRPQVVRPYPPHQQQHRHGQVPPSQQRQVVQPSGPQQYIPPQMPRSQTAAQRQKVPPQMPRSHHPPQQPQIPPHMPQAQTPSQPQDSLPQMPPLQTPSQQQAMPSQPLLPQPPPQQQTLHPQISRSQTTSQQHAIPPQVPRLQTPAQQPRGPYSPAIQRPSHNLPLPPTQPSPTENPPKKRTHVDLTADDDDKEVIAGLSMHQAKKPRVETSPPQPIHSVSGNFMNVFGPGVPQAYMQTPSPRSQASAMSANGIPTYPAQPMPPSLEMSQQQNMGPRVHGSPMPQPSPVTSQQQYVGPRMNEPPMPQPCPRMPTASPRMPSQLLPPQPSPTGYASPSMTSVMPQQFPPAPSRPTPTPQTPAVPTPTTPAPPPQVPTPASTAPTSPTGSGKPNPVPIGQDLLVTHRSGLKSLLKDVRVMNNGHIANCKKEGPPRMMTLGEIVTGYNGARGRREEDMLDGEACKQWLMSAVMEFRKKNGAS